jgi:hypothetical protein
VNATIPSPNTNKIQNKVVTFSNAPNSLGTSSDISDISEISEDSEYDTDLTEDDNNSDMIDLTPQPSWSLALKQGHEGHNGINKTFNLAKEYMKAHNLPIPPGGKEDARILVSNCLTCQKQRSKPDEIFLPRTSLYDDNVFRTLQIDFLEGLGKSGKEPLYASPGPRKKEMHPTSILVIVDAFSRYVKLYPCFEKTAETVRNCLVNLFCDMGHPAVIVSDGGPAFKSEALDRFLKAYGIEHKITHPHLPSAHGIVERVNKETLKHLRIILDGCVHLPYEEWRDIIPLVQHRLNTTYNGAINTTPATIIFGSKGVYERRLDSGQNIDLTKGTDSYIRLLDDRLRTIRDLSLKYQEDNAIRNYEISTKHAFSILQPGDYVFKINRPDPYFKKLTFKWTGPYRIIKNEGRIDFYEVKNLVQDQTEILHRSELKLTQCLSDEEARRSHAQQERELFIEKILKHSGDPTKPNTVQFLCEVSGLDEPLIFDFKDSKTIPKLIDYIKDHDDLKPLLRHTIDERTERRKTKGTYRQGRYQ